MTQPSMGYVEVSDLAAWLDRCVVRLRADLDRIEDAPTRHRREGAIEVLEAIAEIMRDGSLRRGER